MSEIKIAIVDDHQIFRKGLELLLNEIDRVEVVGSFSNGVEILEFLKNNKVDIVFMDIKMPVMNGIEATKEISKLYPDVKVIVLSMFGDDEYIESMIEAGARGFCLKNESKSGLEKAIRLVSEGKNYYSEELMDFFTRSYISKSKKQNETVKLTKRELEILQLIAEGYTNQEIAAKLFISQRTVDGHRANLISKTNSKNTVSLIAYAIKNKLVKL